LTVPQQNRVDPWGRLHAVTNLGMMMGNRGILHDERGAIVRQWASQHWVTCLLDFRERRSPGAFRPGHYSKLFFLDEATAFAAGHRPCGECQRARYLAFRAAWIAANVPAGEGEKFSVQALDRQLHSERTASRAQGTNVSFLQARVVDLPPGALVEWADHAWLVTPPGQLRRWSFDGYAAPRDAPQESVRVLTPASVVRAFRHGFAPQVHASGL
jgi:hypothetical protein